MDLPKIKITEDVSIDNIEIISITKNDDGTRSALVSFRKTGSSGVSDDINDGYDCMSVPVNIRPIQLSPRDNILCNQSFDGEVIQDKDDGQEIDLNKCLPGDLLISKHGLSLEYVSKTPWGIYNYLDHVVKYIEDPIGGGAINGDSYGTRTNDGYVFSKMRKPSDHDIVKVIRRKEFLSKPETNNEI